MNETPYQILRRSVSGWNQYRADNPDAAVDLRGAYLEGADLRGADLRLANLRLADLRLANLRLADLRGADLEGADLHGADLIGAYLRLADLRGAYLAHTILIDAGQDHRGYRFVGVPTGEGLRILAGCRWFSLEEAKAHWVDNRDALARVAFIEGAYARACECA